MAIVFCGLKSFLNTSINNNQIFFSEVVIYKKTLPPIIGEWLLACKLAHKTHFITLLTLGMEVDALQNIFGSIISQHIG